MCHCTCCLFRFTEDGCPHKKFFHTRYLMRMRLTPDCSKMLISTSSGYLLILHDLDLTQSLEVGSYRILRARRAPLSTGTYIKPKQRYRWIWNDEYCVLKSWKLISIQRVKFAIDRIRATFKNLTIIPPVFSVTWFSRYHYNTLICFSNVYCQC